MRYLGLSLGMSVVLGLTSVFGALVPPIYRDLAGLGGETMTSMLQGSGGQLVLLGVAVCVVGIVICGRAGMLKERTVSEADKKASVAEFHLARGLFVAIVSGVLSACFNFGIEAGQSMAKLAVERGSNPLFQNNVVFVVVLWGGLTTNLIWCVVLNARNRTFADYLNAATPLRANYLLCAVAGITWFLQFFFYGMGASKLSNGASSWILHMAFIILVSNGWGMVLKEWRGVSRGTFRLVLTGIAVILGSVVLVGYGNSLGSGH